MQKTSVFWTVVRSHWGDLISANQSLSLKKTVDGQPLFMPLFSSAETEYQAKDMKKSIDAIITKYVN